MRATAAAGALAAAGLVALEVGAPAMAQAAEAAAARKALGVPVAAADIAPVAPGEVQAMQDRLGKAAAEAKAAKAAATLPVPAGAEAAVAITVAVAAVPARPTFTAATPAEAGVAARLTSSRAPQACICGEGGKIQPVTG